MLVPAAMRALLAFLPALFLPFMAFMVFECDPYIGAPYVVVWCPNFLIFISIYCLLKGDK